MKVLYVGTYRDGTGWGHCCQDYILAMDSVGIEVVPRPIVSYRNPNNVIDIPSRILELEKNDESDCDICIQHVLPTMTSYNGRFKKNIAVFMCESSNFRSSQWAEYLNCMDNVWVCNDQMVSACKDSYVNVPISVIPLCFDVSKYSQRYESFDVKEENSDFKFYTICEARQRKNLQALLKAFHLEFGLDEQVSLVLKSNVPGKNSQESYKEICRISNEVKNGLKIYKGVDDYKKEIIITDWLGDHEIMRLHKTCDCFVLPSYGEAWGIPGFDAMAMGNPVILTDEGGPKQFVDNEKNGLLVPCRDEPAFMTGDEASVPGIWTGIENWKSVDVGELRKSMRRVYEDKELRSRLSKNGIDRAYDFSFETVGNIIKKELETLLNNE